MGRDRLTFLVVMAHPHDLTHVSGTCGIHTSLGDSVVWVAMSAGEGTHYRMHTTELSKPDEEQDPSLVNMTRAEARELKIGELREVAAMFDVTDLRVLDYPDPFRLDRSPEAVMNLRDIILEVRPQVLITQSPHSERRHGLTSGAKDSHAETAFAALDARYEAAIGQYGTGTRPHSVALTLFPGVYYNREQFDFLVDISEWHEQRVRAEATFRSQGHTEATAKRQIEVGVGNFGWDAGTLYAEGFVSEEPPLLDRVSVPKAAIRQAAEPVTTSILRRSGEVKELK